MLFRLFFCACAAFGLGWKGFITNTSPSTPPPTRWVLSGLEGQPLPVAQLKARPHLLLPTAHPAQRTSCRGQFSPPVTTRLLQLPRVISTMMGASDAAVATELHYLSALEQSTHFEVKGNFLHLYAAEHTTPLATFRASRVL